MNKELLQIFTNINDWLRFAEGKNAMIIAFNGASIYGIVKLPFIDYSSSFGFWEGYSIFVIVLLIFSSLVALLSFVPNLHFLKGSTYLKSNNVNLLFYEHIKTYSEEKLKELFAEKMNSSVKDFSKLDNDLITQIKYNATIGSRKYQHFTVAVWATIAAYGTVILALIFAAFHYKNEI